MPKDVVVDERGGTFRCRFTTERNGSPRTRNVVARDAADAKARLTKVFGALATFMVTAYVC